MGIAIAQIGCGHWGKNLARNWAELGALAAVVDGNPATAAAIAGQHAVPARDWLAVLADPSITGVSLATPAQTHAALAEAAFAAGKHVFVEKPMAMTEAECRGMLSAAGRAGRVLMVGHLLRYHPVFLALLDLVRANEIGPLRHLSSARLSLGKFRTEEDVLWSFAPHDLSMLLALAGRPVTTVSAQGAAFVTPGIADVATCQIGFEGGLRGHVHVSWAHPVKEQKLVAIGTTGMAVFEDSAADWDRKLLVYRHRIDTTGPVPVPAPAAAETVPVSRAEPLRSECAEFLAAIRGGRIPRTDGAEGLAVISVLERASAAIRAGDMPGEPAASTAMPPGRSTAAVAFA